MDRVKRSPKLDSSRIKNRIATLADPRSTWSLDDILTEINSLESRFSMKRSETDRSMHTRTWTDARSQDDTKGSELRQSKFVKSRYDDETMSDFYGGIVESYDHSLLHAKETRGSRFTCGDVDLSSDSEESSHELEIKENETLLAAETRLEDHCLWEWELDRQHGVKEEIREMISLLNTSMRKELEKLASLLTRVQEDIIDKREMYTRGDKQYQRNIAHIATVIYLKFREIMNMHLR